MLKFAKQYPFRGCLSCSNDVAAHDAYLSSAKNDPAASLSAPNSLKSKAEGSCKSDGN
jgi:hypothetical protein